MYKIILQSDYKVVVEQKPTYRTLLDDNGERHFVYVPWTYSVITYKKKRKIKFEKLWAFFSHRHINIHADRNRKLLKHNVLLYYGLLGRVCLGSAAPKNCYENIQLMTEDILSRYWTSTFKNESDGENADGDFWKYWEKSSRNKILERVKRISGMFCFCEIST